MTTRWASIGLTALGVAGYLWQGDDLAGLGLALVGAVVVAGAIFLVSGVARRILAAVGIVAWLAALTVDVATSAVPPVVWLAGLCGLAAALLTAVRGSTWPGWSGRYSRSSDANPRGPDDPRSMWESLDRGEDPTHNGDAPHTP